MAQDNTEDHRLSARERVALALLALFAIGCMIAAVFVTTRVIARIDSYGTAQNDNLQWTISQIEVDQLRFRLALDRLDAADPPSLDLVRQRFDLLYSRAVTLRTAPAYRASLARAGAADEVAQVMAILDAMIPPIDSDDAGLIAARAALRAQAARLTPPIQRIAATALAIGANRSDAERRRLTAQIVTLTGLSATMFVALFALLVLLWRLYRGRLRAEAAVASAREEALSVEQARARFLGMTSHEMRTPLNSLLGALELLEDSDLDADQRGHARIMRQSGDALRAHIEEALDGLSPGGAPEIRPAPFDLDTLLADLVTAQGAVAKARGNTLRLDPAQPGLGMVTGDARRLGQVLLNLVSNAVKFTRDGIITLSAWRGRGDEVVLAVHDTGIGIPKTGQTAIFEDFVRLHADGQDARGDAAETASGSGLGLSIARRIVTAMGGGITVQSRPGAGSTFRVRVPLPRTAEEAVPAIAPPGRLRVLLAEDAPASRTVTEAMLARDGHSVETAADGIEALHRAETTAFDLILMDLDMPRLDGIAATRQIRQGTGPNAATPIVALTAWHGETTAAALRDAGADWVERKPLSRAALRRLLAQEAALIDTDHVARMRDALSAARMADTMAALDREAEALLADLEAGPGGPGDLAARIHRLAGGAATCGARALHARLARIEAALDGGQRARAGALCAGLPLLWSRTRAALHAFLQIA